MEDLFKHKPDQQYDEDDTFANVPVFEFDESVYHQQIKEALECSKDSEIVLGPDDYTEDTSCYESDQPVVPAVSGKKSRPLLKHKPSTGLWTEPSGSRNVPPGRPVKLKPGNAYELAQELIKRVDFIIVCSAIYMFNRIVYELLDNETLDYFVITTDRRYLYHEKRTFHRSSHRGARGFRRYRAYSARSDQRPEFRQMISDAKSGRFQAVLVHKLDRFSRDRYDSAYYRHELKKHGVTVRSVIENLDDSPESVILQSVIEGMNEYYSRNLARETMKGLKENAYNGKHTGGMPPLGYRVDPEIMKIRIDENEANAVRLIFSMTDEGKKYPDILAELKSRGFRTKMGKTFTSTSVHDILRNEKYIGICVYNRRVSQSVANNSRKFKDKSEWIVRDNAYPPLIDRGQFNRIQERMKLRRISNQAHPKEVYLLSGKIQCG